MKKLLISAAALLLLIAPVRATTYYWYVNSAYYPVGSVDDGDPQGFVSSTSLPTILRLLNAAKQKYPN